MFKDQLSSFLTPQRQGNLALLLWGGIVLFLLRHDPYGLEENAAKALLLCWSIVDQVANSVITFGTPDLRTLLFLPTGFLWTGNIFVAKILTVLLLASAAYIYYLWERKRTDSESALIAVGLFLVCPLTIYQIDSLSTGPYLLSAFAFGAYLDSKYANDPRIFGGLFFAQLLTCAFAVSLHPAGIAYPLALLWTWRSRLPSHKNYKLSMASVVMAVLFILLLRMGWGEMSWLRNPVRSLESVFYGLVLDNNGVVTNHLIVGVLVAASLAAVLATQYRQLWSDLTGRSLLLGVLIGAFSADLAWSLIALAVILFYGLPVLLRLGQQAVEGGFLRQRGWILLLIFACLTIFMHSDRTQYETVKKGVLSAQDQLIKTLAIEAENQRQSDEADNSDQTQHLIVASQWPSRTMIACKCDTLPLPPAAANPKAQLANLKGISYLLFDPKQIGNVELARNISQLGDSIDTASLQSGGVLMHVKGTENNEQNQ